MKDKNKTFGLIDIGIFLFTLILIVIFSQNVGLAFLTKVVSYMLSLYVHHEEITNQQMFKLVVFSVTFVYLHIVQSLAYVLGFTFKLVLVVLYSKLKATN